jgi:hypothetical protein
MIEAEEVRLKTEIDGIVAKINATMQNIESVIPKDEAPAESNSEDRPDSRIQAG